MSVPLFHSLATRTQPAPTMWDHSFALANLDFMDLGSPVVITMNAMAREQEITAMRKPPVPIPWVLLHAHVSPDTLEMGPIARVCHLLFLSSGGTLVTCLLLDANECAHQGSDNNCVNGTSTCTNTVGSFYCTCIAGYSGDGTACSGELLHTLPVFHFWFLLFQN